MTSRDHLDSVLQTLPESRIQEVLDFAQFLSSQEDRQEWQEFGRRQLARAYGSDEPEYGPDDIKPATGRTLGKPRALSVGLTWSG
jgi:hypothetical protein